MFLNRELTPKSAWLELRSRILADNKENKCQPLIPWIQADVSQIVRHGPVLVQATTDLGTPDAAKIICNYGNNIGKLLYYEPTIIFVWERWLSGY